MEIQIRIEEPRIVAKVLHSDPVGLIGALSQKKVVSQELRGGQIAVRLPYHGWDMIGEMGLYSIPPELKPGVNHRIDVRFNCEERGGALTHRKTQLRYGRAMIVCGLNGQPLLPFCVPCKNVEPCGVHARFCVSDAVVTVVAESDTLKPAAEYICITKHQIVFPQKSSQVGLKREEVWRGPLPQLPAEFADSFGLAVQAAFAKVTCICCSETHFLPRCVRTAPVRVVDPRQHSVVVV